MDYLTEDQLEDAIKWEAGKAIGVRDINTTLYRGADTDVSIFEDLAYAGVMRPHDKQADLLPSYSFDIGFLDFGTSDATACGILSVEPDTQAVVLADNYLEIEPRKRGVIKFADVGEHEKLQQVVKFFETQSAKYQISEIAVICDNSNPIAIDTLNAISSKWITFNPCVKKETIRGEAVWNEAIAIVYLRSLFSLDKLVLKNTRLYHCHKSLIIDRFTKKLDTSYANHLLSHGPVALIYASYFIRNMI